MTKLTKLTKLSISNDAFILRQTHDDFHNLALYTKYRKE
jgi:hypothetical protein